MDRALKERQLQSLLREYLALPEGIRRREVAEALMRTQNEFTEETNGFQSSDSANAIELDRGGPEGTEDIHGG